MVDTREGTGEELDELAGRLAGELKIGKGFLVKNLPAVLVFWRGSKVGEAGADVEAESLAELIRSEAGPPRGV